MGALGASSSWGRRWADAVREGLHRLPDALSSGALYTLLFATIIALFGTAHVMIISPIVVIFRGRRRKMFPTSLIPRVIVTLLALNVLAYAATLNLAACIALNIAVPFLLVMVQASQFEPKAYFGYVMAFVFLELRPLTFSEFTVQLSATAYAAAVLAAVLLVMRWRRGRGASPERELDETLERVADLLDRLACGATAGDVRPDLDELEAAFDRLCFAGRRLVRRPDRIAFRQRLFATLVQRAIYLIDDSAWQRGMDADLDASALHDVAAMIRQVKRAKTKEERAVVHRWLQMLLEMVQLPEGRIRVFFRSTMHILMLIVGDAAPRRRGMARGIEPVRDSLARLARALDPDTFEFRFATRLATVMVLTCAVSLQTGYDHAYWLPLNAFLLLMPSYEESSHRMVTRPIGTAIGCLVAFAVAHLLTEPPEVYAFCMVMITLVYACSPGSWVQAVYATSFTLAMCSLTMVETTAMALRLAYVCLAAIIVLAVNRFVLPSTRKRIYEGNRRQLFEFCRAWWRIVAKSIDRDVGIDRSADMLSAFHLIYGEAYGYAQGLPERSERERECAHLVTLWHMLSEVEQVEYLVLAGELDDVDSGLLRDIAARLGDKVVPQQPDCPAVELAARIANDDLRYALVHYIENAFALAPREDPARRTAREDRVA